MRIWKITLAVVLLASFATVVLAQPAGPRHFDKDPSYDHDPYGTHPREEFREFDGYVVSFDGPDDDFQMGQPMALGIPQFVAYELKRYEGACIPTSKKRPKWFSDQELVERGLAPEDESYSIPKEERDRMEHQIDRGHMAAKFLMARMGPTAEYNSFSLLNACPQYHDLNAGIWLELERQTGAWAQHYGEVWVIAGPVFLSRDLSKAEFIGDAQKGEKTVAVPEAFFKIVYRREAGWVRALAFIFEQKGYYPKPYDISRYMTTVDEVERLTGLDFFTALPDEMEADMEMRAEDKAWEAEPMDYLPSCEEDDQSALDPLPGVPQLPGQEKVLLESILRQSQAQVPSPNTGARQSCH